MTVYRRHPYECPKCGFTAPLKKNMVAHFGRDCEVAEHANCNELTNEIREHVLQNKVWGGAMHYFNRWFSDELSMANEYRKNKRHDAFYEKIIWEYLSSIGVRVLNRDIDCDYLAGWVIFEVSQRYVFYVHNVDQIIDTDHNRRMVFFIRDVREGVAIRDEATGEDVFVKRF
jgi:hypothetical protein